MFQQTKDFKRSGGLLWRRRVTLVEAEMPLGQRTPKLWAPLPRLIPALRLCGSHQIRRSHS